MSRASELSKKIAEFRKQHRIDPRIKRLMSRSIHWENKLLLLFHELEGMATLKQIYELIEKRQDMFQLKSEHFRPTKWGGRPAYEHQVRSHIANLVQSGHLKWVDRGQYRITEKGLSRVKLAPTD